MEAVEKRFSGCFGADRVERHGSIVMFMPMPPILDLFVVWHPLDDLGEQVADQLARHFHSATFSGLAGGAIEVYVRSVAWDGEQGPPRPLPVHEPWPNNLAAAQFTAIVPILGVHLARAFQKDERWERYMNAIFEADLSGDVGVYQLRVPGAALEGTGLAKAATNPQALSSGCATDATTLCREISQAIAQRVTKATQGVERIKVFVSHTKHHSSEEQAQNGPWLFDHVREVILSTRLEAFFDASDIQAGTDWRATLDAEASTGALLMIRTDIYSGREWTQREVVAAKRHDMPIVCLHALSKGEERGSFLMDHVPVVPCDVLDPAPSILKALNRIVDEALKRALWEAQSTYRSSDGFDWRPVHSPEPATLTPWLLNHRALEPEDPHVWIMHPDPPLGPPEYEAIVELCMLAGFSDDVEIHTPRTFAARGGKLRE
jgi:hypothetical protein